MVANAALARVGLGGERVHHGRQGCEDTLPVRKLCYCHGGSTGKGRTFVHVLGRTLPPRAHPAWLWPCCVNSLESGLRGAVGGYGLGWGCHCPGERLGGDGVTVAVGWRQQSRVGRWRGLSDEGKRGSGTTYSHHIPRGWHLVGAL